jgi:hypothetical protein
LGRQRYLGIVEVDSKHLAGRPDALRGIQRPRARTCSEIENALALFEQTDASIDFLKLVDRASRVAFASRAAPVVILLAARGQLALFGSFRRFHGFF